MKKMSIILLCVLGIVLQLTACGNETSVSEKTEIISLPEVETQDEPKVYEYDTLQKLFMIVDVDTTIEDIENYISENSLSYTLDEYNTIGGDKELQYKIAYTDGVALQKYADSGDYIEVSFAKTDDNHILVANYVKATQIGYTGIFYNDGTWYDFSGKEKMDGDYIGYYIDDTFGKEKGIEITYNNGNKTSTNYFKCDSAEEVIQKILEHEE
jgi:hypothetical protein